MHPAQLRLQLRLQHHSQAVSSQADQQLRVVNSDQHRVANLDQLQAVNSASGW